jgi:uncharacterized membrane protein
MHQSHEKLVEGAVVQYTNTTASEFEEQPTAWSLSDLECWGAATVGTALMAYGISRRSVSGVLLAFSAIPLAYRGFTGEWPPPFNGLLVHGQNGDTRVALSGERGIHVRESVRIEKPLAEVYRFWRQLENLPRFMTHLESVTELGNGRSHWVAKGPGGVRVEWDADIINEVDNKVIGWQSLEGSDVVTAGSVNFEPVRDRRSTQIQVHLQYAPPAGRLGTAGAMLVGREPSQTIREDLRRLKQLLEAGEVPTASTPQPAWSQP